MRMMRFFAALIICLFASLSAMAVPVANAGPDRSALTNEPIVIDGSASTGCDDLLQTDGKHSRQWEFGYANWTYQGALLAPIAYPLAGTYTITLKCYDSGGALSSDTAIITITDVVEGSSTTITDTGNPVTNGTNLCNQFTTDAAANNPVITLTAGVIYRMNCAPPNRTGSGYLTVKSSAVGSLPVSTNRVTAANDANLAIIETDTAVGPAIDAPPSSATNSHHYRFVGILFRKSVASAAVVNLIELGGGGAAASLSVLPHHFIFDRCRFDGGTTTSNSRRAILISASDVAIVNSHFSLFKENGSDAQAVLMLQGERLNLTNNYLDAAGENFMSGGEDPTITDHVPSYFVIRRNHFKKDLGYFINAGNFGATYYGINYTVKNIFELKNAKYISVQGNTFENHWLEDQNWAITLTIVNQGGAATWSTIQYLDFAHNKIDKFFWGINIATEAIDQVSVPALTWVIRHNIFTRYAYYTPDSRHAFAIITNGSGGGDRIFVVSNSSTQNSDYNRALEFAMSAGAKPTNVYWWNNITSGWFTDGALDGTAALNANLASYSVTKNLWYAVSGTNPAGSTQVTAIGDVGYTDFANGNLFLTANTTVGLLGGRPGADTVAVDTLTSGVVSGNWTGLVCNWHTPIVCN